MALRNIYYIIIIIISLETVFITIIIFLTFLFFSFTKILNNHIPLSLSSFVWNCSQEKLGTLSLSFSVFELLFSLFNGGSGACNIDRLRCITSEINQQSFLFCVVFCNVMKTWESLKWIMLPFGFLTFVLGLLENVLKKNILVERLSFYCFSVKGVWMKKKKV